MYFPNPSRANAPIYLNALQYFAAIHYCTPFGRFRNGLMQNTGKHSSKWNIGTKWLKKTFLTAVWRKCGRILESIWKQPTGVFYEESCSQISRKIHRKTSVSESLLYTASSLNLQHY